MAEQKQTWGQRMAQRYDDEMLRIAAHAPKEESKPIDDEAWFGIFTLIGFGFGIGFVVGWIIFGLMGA